jgi:gamma-glutamylcyclotransferase (GGCT)/AIG2-like uncharacterized protein YtfP
MPHILCFGSLRQHSSKGYNFERLGLQKYIRDVMLKGYVLHDLGAYPAVCKGAGTVKAELHEVSAATHTRIRKMELSAGYDEAMVPVDNVQAALYIMTPDQLAHYPKVPSGDWA